MTPKSFQATLTDDFVCDHPRLGRQRWGQRLWQRHVEHDGPHDDAAARLKGERHRPKGHKNRKIGTSKDTLWKFIAMDAMVH